MTQNLVERADEAYAESIRQELALLLQHGYGRVEIEVQDSHVVQVEMTKRVRRKSANKH